MAELPELETLRRELEKEAVGKRFKAPEVTTTKAVARTGTKKVFSERVEGAKVKNFERRHGALVATLDSGDGLVFLLGEQGRMEKAAPKDAVPKGTAVTFGFTQGGLL